MATNQFNPDIYADEGASNAQPSAPPLDDVPPAYNTENTVPTGGAIQPVRVGPPQQVVYVQQPAGQPIQYVQPQQPIQGQQPQQYIQPQQIQQGQQVQYVQPIQAQQIQYVQGQTVPMQQGYLPPQTVVIPQPQQLQPKTVVVAAQPSPQPKVVGSRPTTRFPAQLYCTKCQTVCHYDHMPHCIVI